MEDTRIIELARLYSEGGNVDIELQDLFTNLMNISNLDDIYVKRALGIMYLYGQGVKKDYLQAYTWLSVAALQGDAFSQNIIGVMYKNGYGIVQNEKSALKWYSEAAKNDNSKAMINLGDYYSEREEYSTALEWYEKALELDGGEAAFEIGCCYFVGIAVEENEENAYKYFLQAAEKGFTHGVKFVELYKENNKKADKYYKMAGMLEKSSCIMDAKRKAMMFYDKAADYGNTNAQTYMGLNYLNGNDYVEINYSKSYKYLKAAAKSGDTIAINSLGYMYTKGYGVAKNDKKAFVLFKKAAQRGNVLAMKNVAIAYEQGKGCLPNQKKALRWYKEAEANGWEKGHDVIKRIENRENAIDNKSREIRFGGKLHLAFSILVGLSLFILFWSALEEAYLYHIYSFIIIYLCGIIIPRIMQLINGAKVSIRAKRNEMIVGTIYFFELLAFSVVYTLIRKNVINMGICDGVSSKSIGAVFISFLIGMIVLNYRNLICARQVNNPIGLIFLSLIVISLYSILVYTILLETLANMFAIGMVLLLIGFAIYAIGWFFCLW